MGSSCLSAIVTRRFLFLSGVCQTPPPTTSTSSPLFLCLSIGCESKNTRYQTSARHKSHIKAKPACNSVSEDEWQKNRMRCRLKSKHIEGTWLIACSKHPQELATDLLWMQVPSNSSVSSYNLRHTPWCWDQDSVGACYTLKMVLDVLGCMFRAIVPLQNKFRVNHTNTPIVLCDG